MDIINIRKRYPIILAALIILCALFCCSAGAEGMDIIASGDCSAQGSSVSWVLDAEGTLTIEGTGAMKDYSSTSMPWNSNKNVITKVVIEDGVTNVGNYAFSGCSSLTSITLPESVTFIYESAFEFCGLTEVIIPDSVISISAEAFYGNPLERVYFPGEDVPAIVKGAIPITSIIVCHPGSDVEEWAVANGYTVEDIGSAVLPTAMPTLKPTATPTPKPTATPTPVPTAVPTVVPTATPTPVPTVTPTPIPTLEPTATPEPTTAPEIVASGTCGAEGDNLTWTLDGEGTLTISGEGPMADYVFDANVFTCTSPWGPKSSIVKVIVQDGVTTIGNYGLYDLRNLSSISLPDTLTSIGSHAFSAYAPELEHGAGVFSSITIPDSVNFIGRHAFDSCQNLTSIVIPDGVTAINDGTFYNCNSLTDVTIPDSVISIGGSAFYECRGLTSISIPEGVTSIGGYAFYNCNCLTSITIPASVTTIGNSAFSSCRNLTDVTIPEGVQTIGNYAFRFCGRNTQTKISIPDSVVSIGDFAFELGWGTEERLAIFFFQGRDLPELGKCLFNDIDYSAHPVIYCHEHSDVDYWAFENGYETFYLEDDDFLLSVTLPADCTLAVGKSMTVKPVLFPAQKDAEIVWNSSNPSIVSVENGVLTAIGVGTATITASYGERSDSMVITTYGEVASFELPEEIWMLAKNTMQLTVENILPVGATGFFSYASSDTAKLTVDENGLMTGIRPGDATVTVTSNNGISRSCTVHVCYPVTAIELDQTVLSMNVGDTAQLTASVTAKTQSFVNKLVEFTSSDESILTVDENGFVTAVGSGTATVTVSAASGITAQCSVTVGEIVVVPAGLTIPANTTIIGAEAFEGVAAEQIIIPEGCKSIGARAFADCENLSKLSIPESVTTIAFDALENCPNVTIHAPENSYAHAYARVFGIPFVTA